MTLTAARTSLSMPPGRGGDDTVSTALRDGSTIDMRQGEAIFNFFSAGLIAGLELNFLGFRHTL